MKKPGRRFWEKVGKAREPILALDYDGTIAPFREKRMEARPLTGIVKVLLSIADNHRTRLAIVSGRPILELEELLGSKLAQRIILIGSHGWELSEPGRKTRSSAVDPAIGQVLDKALHIARAAWKDEMDSGDDPNSRIESKTASVAVHIRGMDADGARRWIERVRGSWTPLLSGGLEFLQFNGGIEIRSKGRDKGSAILELVEHFPETDLLVYIGDDATDEDAFRRLPGFGVGIKVGMARETAAGYQLPDCEAVRDFLDSWAQTDQELRGEKE